MTRAVSRWDPGASPMLDQPRANTMREVERKDLRPPSLKQHVLIKKDHGPVTQLKASKGGVVEVAV